jgi:Xaa-Pro aminopeptidase
LVAGALPTPRPDRLLVSDTLWASFILRIQHAFRGATLEPASRLLAPLRAVKDREEVELLREAAHAADRVVGAIASGRLVGRTERDVAREVRERLVDEGHDVPSFWTVASGENTAAPHHSDSDRMIRAGEPLLLDIGGRLGGYSSDITRTVWVGGDDGTGPDEEFRRLYAVVDEAQVAGRAAARPGVPCEAVDAAARAVVESAGYGERFLHRTGHGIGLEVHESPYLVAGNDEPLAAGHAFSVEPGIYLEGRYGARIEDIVVCTDDGPDTLNDAPRELLTVRGI